MNARNYILNSIRRIYSSLPFSGIKRPIFIVGCGRSGTTILGTVLSKHRLVTYLNEPVDLWFSAYENTDIWTSNAVRRNGKLFLTHADAEYLKSQKLGRLFRFETIISGKPILIEKLPINNFRLSFIHQIFPDAIFIHIYRNGLEVARSIEKRGDTWFGVNSYKWNKLVEYALTKTDTNILPALCSTNFDRGLLEWRLSTESAITFLSLLQENSFFELSYNELIKDPVKTLSRCLDFIGIHFDEEVKNFAIKEIHRKTSPINEYELSDKEKMLGGKLLLLSMDGKNGLIRRVPDLA